MAVSSVEVENLKQKNKVRKLIKILGDPRHEIRASAARALGEIGDVPRQDDGCSTGDHAGKACG